MQLAHDLSTDSLVTRAGSLSAIANLSMVRGNVSLAVQFCTGNANTALPVGTTVYYGLKSTANPKGSWLSLVQLQLLDGSTGLFQGVLQNNTPEMIAATHADPDDPEPENMSLPVYGQLHYFLPGSTQPNFSQFITVTVTGVLWTGVESIAPSPNIPFPPPDQVDTKAARDLAIAAAVASLEANPGGVVTNAVASRIAGKTASAATQTAFSALDDNAHVYTRNAGLFCADIVPTSVSVFTSASGVNAGWKITMLTARHGYTNHHIEMPVGTNGVWVDADGVSHPATVATVQNVIGDFDLVTLDRDLPPSIQPSPVLPPTLPSGYFSGANSLLGVPVITYDQNRHFCLATLAGFGGSPVSASLAMPTAGDYAVWNRNNDTPGNTSGTPGILNDSSSPAFLVLGGQMVHIGSFFGTSVLGPDPGANAAAISAIINPQGYALTIANVPGATSGSSGTSALTLNPVATDAAKLALTGIAAGYTVRITGEGNRIETFLGGDPTSNANWQPWGNTVNLTVQNESSSSFSVNGMVCPVESTTNLGWVNPLALQISGLGTAILGLSFYVYNLLPNGTGADVSSAQSIADGPYAVPYFPLRCVDATLNLTDGYGF